MNVSPRPGFALWLTGLPASGKTTLARLLQQRLAARGHHVQLLDSDALRRRLTPAPTYSPAERDWFYETLIFLAGLLVDNGVNVIIAATGPRRAYRQAARRQLPRFAEVHVICPEAVCRQRDPKGLWRRAEEGSVTTLPGAGAPYEPPTAPEAAVDTARYDPQQAAALIEAELTTLGFWARD